MLLAAQITAYGRSDRGRKWLWDPGGFLQRRTVLLGSCSAAPMPLCMQYRERCAASSGVRLARGEVGLEGLTLNVGLQEESVE